VTVGTKDLSSQDDDGLWDINCMSTHKCILVYNEDKYWNPTAKKEFFEKVMNYWTPDLLEKSRKEKAIENKANLAIL